MNTEQLIKEVISKACPFHGKRPIVGIHESGQIELSTCCKEFRKFLENIIREERDHEAGSSRKC